MKLLNIIFNNKTLKFIFFTLLTTIFLLVLLLFFQKKNMTKEMDLKMQFIEEKNILRDELDDLIEDHDDLLSEYGDLNEQLSKQDSVIQRQISEIRDLIRTKNDLNKAKVKIKALKEISKRYLANIDSLLEVNKTLSVQKDSVIKVNKNINWQNYKLNEENKKLVDKIDVGSRLEVYNLSITAYRFRKRREIKTRYAKKVQNIKVCFTIAKNKITNPGEKIFFLQIIDPNDSLIIRSDSLKINENEMYYTHMDSFVYENKEVEICTDWERTKRLLPGAYKLKLFIGNRLESEGTIRLK